VTAVLVLVSGITLLARAEGGLFWLIPSVAASIVGGVVNASLVLVRVPA
jgi:hypothetical protein